MFILGISRNFFCLGLHYGCKVSVGILSIISAFSKTKTRAGKNIMIEGRAVVGITQGDINGIGYEVFLKAISDSQFLDLFVPVFYGSSRVAAYYRKILGLTTPTFMQVHNASEARAKRVNIVESVPDDVLVTLGAPSGDSAKAAISALDRSVADWKKGHLDAIVTLPIHKNAMRAVSFEFPGHTEYFSEVTGREAALMLFVSGKLRIGLVTQHVPLSQVPALITKDRVLSKIRELHQALQVDFGITQPRIAVLGLNPHAGEGGTLGSEELDHIEPAVLEAIGEGMRVSGAYPADGFFGVGHWKEFDGVLAMYHDQALAPFKTIAFYDGVNFSSGLPLIRTSPDHGTAYEIAGEGKASPQSFRASVYLAIDIYRNRLIAQNIAKESLPQAPPHESTRFTKS